MRRFLLAALVAVAMVATVAPVQAVPVLDFSLGPAGFGGVIVRTGLGGDYKGTAIPLGQLLVVDMPSNNGVWWTAGTAVGSAGGPWAALDFGTGGIYGNYIRVTGCIPGLGVGMVATVCYPQLLLDGTISSFTASGSTTLSFVATGPDLKSADLLTAVGLPVGTAFEYMTFSFSGRRTSPDLHWVTTSLDLQNTPIPEPASMLLFGSGLVGLAGAVRRRLRK